MRKVIILLIACFLILLPSQAFAGEFSDVKGHWSLQAVNECAALGIVKGYTDATFKPQNTVTHLEAIVLIIKSMGLEQQAKEMDLKKENYNFPEGVTWGQEYLALAADKAIINKEKMANLKPNSPTTRAEIAVMFANAFHLYGDASDLTFADNDQILEIFRSNVAGIVKNGIMVGQPGNKFAPGNTVTRAETVTIISRMLEKGLSDPNPSKFFINKVSGIDRTNQLISLQKSQNVTQPYILVADCQIYRDGTKATLEHFQENDNVKVILDDKGRVKYLANMTGEIPVKHDPVENSNQNNDQNKDQNNNQNNQVPSTEALSGLVNQVMPSSPIKAIITTNSGVPSLYTFDQAVKITQGGTAKDVTAVVAGSSIEFDLTEDKITSIRILSTTSSSDQEVIKKAYVINTSVDYLNLHYEDGEEKEYNIDYTVSLLKGNEAISLSSLQRGDPVEVKKYQNQSRLLSVRVITDGNRKVFGEVVSTSYSEITIKTDDDKEYSYEIDEDTEITNNDAVSIDKQELKDGDDVEIVLDKNNIAITIKAKMSSLTVSGSILSLKTSGDYSLTLERSGGAYRKYNVKDDVTVKKGTKSLDYDELSVGNQVKLYMDSDSDVVKIELQSDSKAIKGKVTSIDDQGSYAITIKKSNGNTAEYDVDEDVDVKEGSKSREFSDISKGDNVELSLDDDDLVTDIEITDEDSSSASGIITDFDWDDEEITLEEDGDETDYEVDEDVEITKDDDEVEPEDLVIGAEVELEIEDDVVVKIIVEDDEDIEVEGEIIKVYDDSVKIKQSSGNQFKYYFEKSASLEDKKGKDIDIEDLDEGMDVQIELRDGKIRKLEVL